MYRTTQETQKRKDAKRRLLLDTAGKMFSEKGYHHTTVKDIVQRAGVSVGTFYFYFKSKEDLFTELYKSVVKEFADITAGVLHIGEFSMVKNYTRVMAATLWMYERKREIARVMLLEVSAANPALRELETARMREFAGIMAGWFTRFQAHEGVRIPDAQVAALIYAGSYSCLMNDWLPAQPPVPLTEHAFAFCVYHLQALNIPFAESAVRAYISEVLLELDRSAEKGRETENG